MEPNKKRIGMLIDALRSGDYAQACGTLKATAPHVAYCCQGVGVSMVLGEDVFVWDRKGDDGTIEWGVYDSMERVEKFWPDEVREWFGINEDDSENLAAMNDRGSSFNDIADWLVEQYGIEE